MSDYVFERPEGLPLPTPTEEAQPFFDALKDQRLVLQRCASCAAWSYPPRAMCPKCGAMGFEWVESKGVGTVYSYVVTHQAVHPALRGHTPFATVEVELDEGPRMTSNLLDVAPEAVEIGLRVTVEFVPVADQVLPYFRRL